MQKKYINPIIQWWVTPKMPSVHLGDKTSLFKKWLIHPVKRRLARWYLVFLKRLGRIRVVAVTGSAGKTTVKEMLSSILAQDGETVYSKENIDPVYNIPSTILSATPSTKYLVLEMGVEYPGEMDFYLWLAKPDVAVITNIFPTHTEFLGNIEGVLKEKSKLALGIPPGGSVVLNAGDKLLVNLSKKLPLNVKIIWFENDLSPFVGNANAAKAAAEAFSLSASEIRRGLEAYPNPPHRLEIIKHPSGAVILDDSYNSNPWAAITTLNYFNDLVRKSRKKDVKKIAVLGDMLELGKFNEEGHRLLGRLVAKSGFTAVIGVGKSTSFILDEVKLKSKKTETYSFSDPFAALPIVRSYLDKNSFILVKGSRSIGLDKIVDKLSRLR
ncbi:MAG TPA: UDP-N-acetylmuramoyl-tripeptide--D-alanyl-D-alanine ligase [Patescibacteria group bacterium]|nr:UDP-N-acetylmuramoyl-tripeptide--D-alanyl-D-alanine ligase [Patescibacteria group bacterium]